MTDLDPGTAITHGEVKTLLDEVIEKLSTKFTMVASGILVVLGLGFITLLVTVIGFVEDANRFKAASYEDLKDQITAQNAKLDLLIQENEKS